MVNLKVLVAGGMSAVAGFGSADARPGFVTTEVYEDSFIDACHAINAQGVFVLDAEGKAATWYAPGSIIMAKPA
jgi:hypothetical protein